MSTVSDINGIFMVDMQTQGTRVKWVLVTLIGLGLLPLGAYYFATDVFYHTGGMESFVAFMFMIVLPGAMVISGLSKMFQKPGVYFTGIRTTEAGFEAGTLTMDLCAIESQSTWKESLAGKISNGNWELQKQIDSLTPSVLVFLKEAGVPKNCHFLDRIAIASRDDVLHQVIGAHNSSTFATGDLVGVLNGECQRLGGPKPMPCNTYLPSLERIDHILSTAGQGNHPSCALNLTARTVHLGMFLPSGMVGKLVAAATDSGKRDELHKAFKKGGLFDADFTQKLIDFAETHGWTITTGGGQLSE